MLTSLFGDLGPARGVKKNPNHDDEADGDGGFAATSIMESVATEVNARGLTVLAEATAGA